MYMSLKKEFFTPNSEVKPGSLVRFYFAVSRIDIPCDEDILVRETRTATNVYGPISSHSEEVDEGSYKYLPFFIFIQEISCVQGRKKFIDSNFYNFSKDARFFLAYSLKKKELVIVRCDDTLIEVLSYSKKG